MKRFEIRISKEHFNSQPHEEADEIYLFSIMIVIHFNSQPHEEADGAGFSAIIFANSISTHSLTRRLTGNTTEPWSTVAFQLTASRGG